MGQVGNTEKGKINSACTIVQKGQPKYLSLVTDLNKYLRVYSSPTLLYLYLFSKVAKYKINIQK